MSENEVEKKENWYGEDVTLEQALEATASLREGFQKNKSMNFDVKAGQVLVSILSQHNLKAGEVCISLKDSPDHTVTVHKEVEKKYILYRGNSNYFKPANEQQIKAFFGVKAEIEKPEAVITSIETGEKISGEPNSIEGETVNSEDDQKLGGEIAEEVLSEDSQDGGNAETVTESDSSDSSETADNPENQ